MTARCAILLFFLAGMFFPLLTHAQLDPRCFSLAECLEARTNKGFTTEKPEEGFYQSNETLRACGDKNLEGKPLGFCLPASQTRTMVAFAGRTQFVNLGDFIQLMYRYAITAAGILATVVLIIAGFQWVLSRGSADRIKAARDRIAAAMMGLFLAVMSFFILDTVNPYLTELRLPQTWLIRQQSLAPIFCQSIPSEDAKLALFLPKKDIETNTPRQVSQLQEQQAKLLTSGSYTVPAKDAECGASYFVPDTGGLTCQGLLCKGTKQHICIQQLQKPDQSLQGGGITQGNFIPDAGIDPTQKRVGTCVRAMLGGTIRAVESSANACSDIRRNIIDNDLRLYAVCPDGDIEEINDIDIGPEEDTHISSNDNNQIYRFEPTNEIETACGRNTRPVGFYLGAEINDEGSIFGNFCPGAAGSTGCDDFFAIGKKNPTSADPNKVDKSNECSVNLSKIAYRTLIGQDIVCVGEEGVKFCSCAAISDEEIMKSLIQLPSFTRHLITLQELQNGFVCDIAVSRLEFPDLDQGLVNCTIWEDTKCTKWHGISDISPLRDRLQHIRPVLR